MTITSLSLTNPGAESGTTTGWTLRVGTTGPTVVNLNDGNGNTPHAGSYYFSGGSGSVSKWDQEVDVSAYSTEIDAFTAGIRGTAYHSSLASQDDEGGLYLEAYDGSHVLLSSKTEDQDSPNPWVYRETFLKLPVGTRYVRLGTNNTLHDGAGINSYWDDFTLDISDDYLVDFGAEEVKLSQGRVRTLQDGGRTRLSQTRVRTLIQFPADAAKLTQARSRFLWGGPGGFQLRFTQGLVRTLIKFGLDSRKLRAWTFTQDDHDFYVLQLGGDITLVYDKLSQLWSQWRSPGYTYWRGSDGVQWEGWNLACDTESGKLWEIDAEGRLDEGVTPIVSVMYGGFTKRFRVEDLCYMAELALSEGQPPSGIEEGATGITLRTSDDGGLTWVNHGEIAGEAASEDITVRWYGLGRMNHPNKLFEITDTGYARRIDGLDVEVSKNG